MCVCVHNNIILEKKTFILFKWGLNIFRLQTKTETNNQSERVSERARKREHWNYPKIVVAVAAAAAAVVSRHKIVQCCVCNAHTHKFSIEKQECDGLKYPYVYIHRSHTVIPLFVPKSSSASCHCCCCCCRYCFK